MRFAPILMAGLAAASAISKRGEAVSNVSGAQLEKFSSLSSSATATWCGGFSYYGCDVLCGALGYGYYACESTVCLCYD